MPSDVKKPSKLTMAPVDLQKDGLLWLINRVVFHPRGFALAYDPVWKTFKLYGNGDEPWHYEKIDEDQKFREVEAAFERVRTHELGKMDLDKRDRSQHGGDGAHDRKAT